MLWAADALCRLANGLLMNVSPFQAQLCGCASELRPLEREAVDV